MNKNQEYQNLKLCLTRIEEKLKWGISKDWSSDTFFELSELIQKETKVLLSPTTLKRVWGRVQYESFPSISTLNTLAQFLGFENWRDFKSNHTSSKPSFLKKIIVPYLGIIVPSAAVLTLVFISFFSMTNSGIDPMDKFNYDAIHFSSKPLVEGLPNSVVFDFDLAGIDSDSIFIQQFWDPTKTIEIDAQQKQATGIYYLPGYFRSKLLIDGQLIKEHDLFIKSSGWTATLDYTPVPKYFKEQDISHNNILSLPTAALQEIKNSENPSVSSFHLVDDFGEVSGDHLTIETTVKNIYNDKWAVCQTLKVVILGTKGAILVPFTQLGCVSDVNLMLNNFYLNGKKNDLSSFGIDLSDSKKLVITIQNKNVSVSVENKTIYEGSYQETIGNFVGLRYLFLGAGEVYDLKVKDLKLDQIISEIGWTGDHSK